MKIELVRIPLAPGLFIVAVAILVAVIYAITGCSSTRSSGSTKRPDGTVVSQSKIRVVK